MNYQEFISSPKSFLIAPAGYGKTYSIAECLRHTPDNHKQLILTHTHAGIASIKEKVTEMGVESSKYHIETITGFAQKYVLAFCDHAEFPPQEDSEVHLRWAVCRRISGLYQKAASDYYVTVGRTSDTYLR